MQGQNKIYNPYNDSLKKLWFYDRKLDRIIGLLQTAFIITFTIRENFFWIFVVVSFICFFSLPIIYLSKFVKGRALNHKLANLASQNRIPSWIPKRRKLISFTYIIIGHPVFWMFFAMASASISQMLPIYLSIGLAIPWYIVDRLHKKEYDILQSYIK